MIAELLTGPYGIPTWFGLAAVFVCVPAWILVLLRRKKREKDFLIRHPDAAVLRIRNGGITGSLNVRSVDGERPVLASKGTKRFLYLAPGEHALSLSYRRTKVSVVGKLSRYFDANRIETEKTATKRMTVKAYEKYNLYYDGRTEAFKFTRKQNQD
ncbi:MAG: hypothetical protein LBP30_04410 [Clostridiales Family XIII bacterium]|nr:hypothetical protein [Clostridiales Family XIII bacterium]